MSTLNTLACDICGAIRRETNHWFRAIAWEAGHFEISTLEKSSAMLLTGPTDSNWPRGVVLDLCSESCAVKAMSQTMTGQQIKRVSPDTHITPTLLPP